MTDRLAGDSARVVYAPQRRHYCGPNDYGYWLEHDHDPKGTVVECGECGLTWVSEGQRYDNVFASTWRREGKWERRRRERRARKAA